MSTALSRALHPVLADYDLVLVDCQPSLGMLTVNALTASDGVIVPLECEYFALRGVALLQETIEKVRDRLNPRLEIEGLLATMYDSRTVHGREVLTRLVEAFGDKVFHTVVSRTVRFPETTVAGQPITSFAPESPGAAAYRQLAREVLAGGRCRPGADRGARGGIVRARGPVRGPSGQLRGTVRPAAEPDRQAQARRHRGGTVAGHRRVHRAYPDRGARTGISTRPASSLSSRPPCSTSRRPGCCPMRRWRTRRTWRCSRLATCCSPGCCSTGRTRRSRRSFAARMRAESLRFPRAVGPREALRQRCCLRWSSRSDRRSSLRWRPARSSPGQCRPSRPNTCTAAA